MAWYDSTFRTDAPVEISEQPDGTIELYWPDRETVVGGRSGLTVLVSREDFAQLIRDGETILAKVAVG